MITQFTLNSESASSQSREEMGEEGRRMRRRRLHLIQLLKAFYLEQPDMVDCFNNRAAEFDVMAHLSSCPQLDQPKAVKASSSLEELETNTRR